MVSSLYTLRETNANIIVDYDNKSSKFIILLTTRRSLNIALVFFVVFFFCFFFYKFERVRLALKGFLKPHRKYL